MKFVLFLLQNQPFVLINMEFLPVFDAPIQQQTSKQQTTSNVSDICLQGIQQTVGIIEEASK